MHHIQIFKNSRAVVDWQSASESISADYAPQCARLVAKCLKEGQLRFKSNQKEQNDPENPVNSDTICFKTKDASFYISDL